MGNTVDIVFPLPFAAPGTTPRLYVLKRGEKRKDYGWFYADEEVTKVEPGTIICWPYQKPRHWELKHYSSDTYVYGCVQKDGRVLAITKEQAQREYILRHTGQLLDQCRKAIDDLKQRLGFTDADIPSIENLYRMAQNHRDRALLEPLIDRAIAHTIGVQSFVDDALFCVNQYRQH